MLKHRKQLKKPKLKRIIELDEDNNENKELNDEMRLDELKKEIEWGLD